MPVGLALIVFTENTHAHPGSRLSWREQDLPTGRGASIAVTWHESGLVMQRSYYLPVQIHWLTAAQTWIPRTGTRLILLAGPRGFTVGPPSSSIA